jgi:hypothetical protein
MVRKPGGQEGVMKASPVFVLSLTLQFSDWIKLIIVEDAVKQI